MVKALIVAHGFVFFIFLPLKKKTTQEGGDWQPASASRGSELAVVVAGRLLVPGWHHFYQNPPRNSGLQSPADRKDEFA